MKQKLWFALYALTFVLPSLATAQNQPLPHPTNLQDREAFLNFDKALDRPFLRFKLAPGTPIPSGTTFVPGDAVPVALPTNIGDGPYEARITDGVHVWVAGLTQISEIIGRPEKGKPDSSWRRTSPAILVPQLPRGKYSIYYAQGTNDGPKTAINVSPAISVAARNAARVGQMVSYRVQLVGPLEAPVEAAASGSKSAPQSFVGQFVQFRGFSHPDVAALVAGQDESVALNDAGVATFRARASSVGETNATFALPGFRMCLTKLKVEQRLTSGGREDPHRQFHIVVLGDSIQWGQGLKTEHKMAERVASYVKGQLGRDVKITRYAHSGATLLPVQGEQGQDDLAPLPGELPVNWPSVAKQLETANDALEEDTVDLVIMDGGINDMPITDILNPITGTSSLIQSRTTKFAKVGMRDVLQDLTASFPFRKSPVLVTGYFRIVSSETNRLMLPIFVGGMVLAIWPDPTTKPLLVPLAAVTTAVAQQKLVDNCAAFHADVLAALGSAVDSTNASPRTKLEGVGDRVHLVKSDFDVKNSIYGPNSLLWQMGFDDEVSGERQAEAINHMFESLAGPVASMGHPNVAGEQQYADNLIAKLKEIRSQWDLNSVKGTFDVKLTQPAFVLTKPLNVQPGLVTQLKTAPLPNSAHSSLKRKVIIECRDHTTGKLVDAYVFQDRVLVGRTNQTLQLDFDLPPAGNDERSLITVSRQGYLDHEFRLPWTTEQGKAN